MPEKLLPQKSWGREALEMREKVRVSDKRRGSDWARGGRKTRARSCQEQTKVKEE